MTLQYGLEASFREGLTSGNTDVLRDCLRTYATIDKTRDAEALFRSCIVKPYMEEVPATLVCSIWKWKHKIIVVHARITLIQLLDVPVYLTDCKK